MILGHRGASSEAPENTLAAFALAREQGADGIEFDVQLSADGRPVVLHDRQVERTTNGNGLVSQLTAAELQNLDAGYGEPVPTLDQVFDLLGPDFLFNVELKEWGWRDSGTAAAVARCVHQHNLDRQVLISSFNPLSIRRARRYLTLSTPIGMLRMSKWLRFGTICARAQADHPYYTLVNDAYMAWARRRGLRVFVWTVDKAEEAQRLAKLGVDGIITNRPAYIRESLGGMELIARSPGGGD